MKTPVSEQTKWILTVLVAVLALVTVLLCALGGVFSFQNKTVKANDSEVSETQQSTDAEDGDVPDDALTVFISAGSGGTANPSGSIRVAPSDSITVSFEPDEGHELSSVTVDGKEVGTEPVYTMENVQEDHSIVASFESSGEK